MLLWESSDLYKELYDNGILLAKPDLEYEFSQTYAHILISGQSKDSKTIYSKLKEKVNEYKNSGLNDEHFERIKKKIYGDYVTEYNSVANIARMFMADKFKGINSFDYIEEFKIVNKKYVQEVLNSVFKDERMVISIVY